MDEMLLDIEQVASYLQMNKMTVYKLARAGRIPAFKIASEWRFKKSLLDNWMMSQLNEQHPSPVKESFTADSSKKTVLVIDNEEIIREFFITNLKEYNVISAANGTLALEYIRQVRPDLILLDMEMPGMNGIETLKRIKEVDESIPVIMLCAQCRSEVNISAMQLGAYTIISKPMDAHQLSSLLHTASSSGKKQKSAAEITAS